MTATNFSEFDLDDSLLDALRDMGFSRPTAIQAEAIPPAMEGRDVLGSAPTGTGKTAAYLLPVLQHLLDFPRKKIRPAADPDTDTDPGTGDAGGRSGSGVGGSYSSGHCDHHRRGGLYEPRRGV
ncbi:hypothetical protein OS21_02510 [Dickeya oryzae]